jgi:hypothetical protein
MIILMSLSMYWERNKRGDNLKIRLPYQTEMNLFSKRYQRPSQYRIIILELLDPLNPEEVKDFKIYQSLLQPNSLQSNSLIHLSRAGFYTFCPNR